MTEFKFAILKNEDRLTMKFLSPYRDRNFKFIFKNVLAIRFKMDDRGFKNDNLIIHQFSLKPKGVCEYDFIFASGRRISVKFKRLEIIENSYRRAVLRADAGEHVFYAAQAKAENKNRQKERKNYGNAYEIS